jgi:uncharacterized membrane protein
MQGEVVMRDPTIDRLRGFAIVTMVGGNYSSMILAQPHPLWVRFIGSVAAATFIFLSGMVVVSGVQTKQYNASHFWQRGAYILACGALMDIAVWQIIPFCGVDVLYIIGISLPLAYYFQKLSAPYRWSIVVLLFGLAPLLRMVFGYTDYPTEIYLSGVVTPSRHPSFILNHWLIDGWFPVFPWLGFSFLGVNLGLLRPKAFSTGSFQSAPNLAAGLGSLLAACVLWQFFPPPMTVRGSWADIFYPPSAAYTLMAVGIILTLLALSDAKPGLKILVPLATLGQCSLFLYILHYILARYLWQPLWPNRQLTVFFLIYIPTLLFLYLIALVTAAFKKRRKHLPKPVRFLIGG